LLLYNFGLGHSDGRRTLGFRLCRGCLPAALNAPADQFRDGLINGAGVGLLLGDAESRQHIDNLVRRDLELPGQLVDADFTHK
jgi:hypothetical protein